MTNQRIGFGYLAWDSALYRIGGCETQNTSTGECDLLSNSEDYGVLNPAGEVSTVNITTADGVGDCSGGSPINCDLPPLGDDAGEGGHLLVNSTILNGYLYVIGGCIDVVCNGADEGSGDDNDISGNVSYVSIASDGSLEAPSTCPGTSYGAWCVDSTNRVNGTDGLAAAGVAVFNNRIYLVGGMEGEGAGDISPNIYYNRVNADGSLDGDWEFVDSIGAGMNDDIAYTYAYARANPSEASTNPGNLFIFGGCGTRSGGVSCSDFQTEVYKCDIRIDGSVDNCTTDNQTQIDSDPDTGGNQGLGIHSGTVYANYIYLIGGYSNTEIDKDEVMYARFDDNNNVVESDGAGTANWTESPNTLSIGRRRGWAFGYNGHIYSLGGYDQDGDQTIPFIEWSKIDVSTGAIEPFVTSSVTINQRWGLSVAVSNAFAYVIGGCDEGESPLGCDSFEESIQTFQLYNNNSGTAAGYTTGANLLATDRVGSSAAIVDNYIYVAGGCTSVTDCTDATNSVQYAAIDEEGDIGTWSAATNLPADRTWGQLEAAGGTLYYIGGQNDTATNEQSTVYYGTPNGVGDVTSWSTATNGLPAARTQFSSAVWNDRIYVVGGIDGSASETNSVYISPQLTSGGNITSAWTTEADVPDVARSGHTVIAYANNLYTLGGFDGDNYLSDTQFTKINSDGTLDEWTFSTSLPVGLRQADGFASNGYMYLFGGRISELDCAPNTFVTPINANTFISVGNEPTGIGEWYETNQNYTSDRYGAAAVLYQGKSYLVGGACPSFVGTTQVLEDDFDATIDGADWTSSTDGSVSSTRCHPGSGNGWIADLSTDSGNTDRELESVDLDVEYGGTIEFDIFAPASNGSDCNAPEGGEDMVLEYSTDGGSNWTQIALYDEADYATSTTIVENIPLEAHSDSTRFRWLQDSYSIGGAPDGFDNWTLDEIDIQANNDPTLTYTGANRVAQTTLLSQPQVARYSRLIDTDSDVFPTNFLLNGIDNSIGARWEVRYQSSTDATSQWGQETEFGEVSLGTVNDYTPLNGAGSNTEFARFYYFWIEIDSSQTFGYPEDINRGPTINDLTLFFTSDPSKRLRHGKTFTGGEEQPLDTPPGP